MGIFDWLFGEKKENEKVNEKKIIQEELEKKFETLKPKSRIKKNVFVAQEPELIKIKERTTLKNNLKKGKKELYIELDSTDGGYTQYYNEKLFTGTSIYFHDNHKEYITDGWEEENWVDGIRHGEKKEFDKDGQLICLEIVERVHNTKYSTVISSKRYSKNGSLIEEFLIGDKYLELKKWHENGEKKEIKKYKKEKRVLLAVNLLEDEFTNVQYMRWDEKGELTFDIDHSRSKKTDEEVEKILLLIDSSLSKNPLYEIVKKRGEIILRTSTDIHESPKLIIDRWSDGHHEEYKVRNESEEDTIFKYKNYLEIYKVINKHIQSNHVDKDDSNKFKELVCLRVSSYSSLDGVRKYMMYTFPGLEIDGKNWGLDYPWKG